MADLVERDIVDEDDVFLGTAAAHRKSRELATGGTDAGQSFHSAEDVAGGAGSAADLVASIGEGRYRGLGIFAKKASGDDGLFRFKNGLDQLNFFEVGSLAAHYADIGFQKGIVADKADLDFVDIFGDAGKGKMTLAVGGGTHLGAEDGDDGVGQGLLSGVIGDFAADLAASLSGESTGAEQDENYEDAHGA